MSQKDLNDMLLGGADEGDLTLVMAAVAGGADIEALDEFGNTAVVLAACAGHLDCLNFLISKDANLDHKGRGGDTGLSYAVSFRQEDCVKALLAAGADPDVRNDAGKTALHDAIIHRLIDVAQELLSAGADPNIADNSGNTPYALSEKYGARQLIRAHLDERRIKDQLADWKDKERHDSRIKAVRRLNASRPKLR